MQGWTEVTEDMSRKTYILSTDGACSGNPGPGGWGVVFYDKQSGKFNTFGGEELHTTNNRMELMAMLRCYQLIMKHFTSSFIGGSAVRAAKAKYNVMSDSSYVVSSILSGNMMQWRRNGWKLRNGNEVKNLDLWEQLSEILDCINLLGSSGPKINLKLVKGHNGNTMNELADMEAVMHRVMAAELLKKKQSSKIGA